MLFRWYNLGLVHMRLGAFKDACGALTRALQLLPRHAEVHSARGLAYKRRHMFDKAIRDFMMAQVLDGRDAEPPVEAVQVPPPPPPPTTTTTTTTRTASMHEGTMQALQSWATKHTARNAAKLTRVEAMVQKLSPRRPTVVAPAPHRRRSSTGSSASSARRAGGLEYRSSSRHLHAASPHSRRSVSETAGAAGAAGASVHAAGIRYHRRASVDSNPAVQRRGAPRALLWDSGDIFARAARKAGADSVHLQTTDTCRRILSECAPFVDFFPL